MILNRIFGNSNYEASSGTNAAFWDNYKQATSSAGQSVTITTAMRVAAVNKAVKLIAGTASVAGIETFERDNTGNINQVFRSDNLLTPYLLHEQPNPELTALDWIETSQGHVLLFGNAYTHIVRDFAGRPAELWILDPLNVEPIRENGVLAYKIKGEANPVPYTDMIHIKAFHVTGLKGVSVIEHGKSVIGNALALQDYGNRYFENDATPSAVIETPVMPDEEQAKRQRESWKKVHGGRNRFGVAWLMPQQKYIPMSATNKDSQWLESRQFSLKDIGNLFEVPSAYLNDPDGDTFASAEQKARDLMKFYFLKLFKKWEHELNSKLYLDTPYFCKFNIADVLRADPLATAEQVKIEIDSGTLTPNEGRRLNRRNTVAGLDYYIFPLNSGRIDAKTGELLLPPQQDKAQNVEDTNAIASEEPQTAEPQMNIAPLLAHAYNQIVAKEVKQVQGIVKKKHEDAKQLQAAVLDYYANADGLETYIVQQIQPIADACNCIDAKELATAYILASTTALKADCEHSEWIGEINSTLDNWTETKAKDLSMSFEVTPAPTTAEAVPTTTTTVNAYIQMPEQPQPQPQVDVSATINVPEQSQTIEVQPTIVIQGENVEMEGKPELVRETEIANE